MKKIIALAFILSAFFNLNAQTKEGFVSYELEVSSDDPDMQMGASMMQGSKLSIYFKEGSTRTEMEMGSMMTMVSISDEKEEKMLLLLSGMIGKKAVVSTFEDIDVKKEEIEEDDTFEIIFTDETKTILGYECKKAIMEDEDGNQMIFWYSDDFEVNKVGSNYMNDKIPGLPLEFEINQGGMIMKMTATDLAKKVKNAKEIFSLEIPEGYEEMTIEELGSMGM